MELLERVRRWLRGGEPALIDYETYEQAQAGAPSGAVAAPAPYRTEHGGADAAENAAALPASVDPASSYKIQQSYDSLLSTVQELRSALDGQARRQEELFDRLSTLPHAAEALPQTSKMQSDMLKMINDRLSMHAQQQRKVSAMVTALAGGGGAAKKEHAEALESIREQIEMGNEIDRQLVESFNRFSMMIDRLQLANQHAVDALQQVRDSYASSAMQMHEWIEKSRQRNNWLIGGAFLMAGASLVIVLILVYMLFSGAGH